MTTQLKPVKQATIEFTESNKSITWSEHDGCLLFFAEAQGIDALSGCRSGYCGACIVELLKGEIVYERKIGIALKDNEVMLCSARPASDHIQLKL